MHTFAKSIRAMWNVNSLVQDLNSGSQVRYTICTSENTNIAYLSDWRQNNGKKQRCERYFSFLETLIEYLKFQRMDHLDKRKYIASFRYQVAGYGEYIPNH